jgi:hypothetical protein
MLRGASCIVSGQSKTPFPRRSKSQIWAHLLGRGLPRHCNIPKLHWRVKSSTGSQLWPCWPVQVVCRRSYRACGSRQHTGACSSLGINKSLVVYGLSKHSRNGRKALTCSTGDLQTRVITRIVMVLWHAWPRAESGLHTARAVGRAMCMPKR